MMHPWYWFCRFCCLLTLRLCFGVKVYGKKNVPRTGGLLLVANHQSFLDPPAIGSSLPRECDYMARKTLFDNPLFGRLIRSVNTFPVEANASDLTTIRTLIDRLKNNRVIVIFPEGARSEDGQLQPFKSGFELIARRSGATTLPVAIEGSFAAWPRGGKISLRQKIRIKFGRPISPEQAKEMPKESYVQQVESQVRRLHSELLDPSRLLP